MTRFVKTFLLLSSLGLTACSTVVGDNGYFHDRSGAYLKAQNGKHIQVPPGLNKRGMTNYYVIPAASGQPTGTALPPDSMAARMGSNADKLLQPAIATSKVHLKNGGSKSALVINQPMTQAWASVASGLQRQRMPIAKIEESKKHYVIVDTYPTFDKIESDSPLYDVIVTAMGKQTKVEIRRPNGQPVNARTVNRLLARLGKGLEGKVKDPDMGDWIHSLF